MNKLIWGVFLFLISLNYLTGIAHDHDDWSVLRASSYLNRFSDDTLLQDLNHHLEQEADDLDVVSYNRYKIRLEVANSYIFSNWFVSVLENLPLYSAYQSSFLASIILHLLASILLFWLLGWVFKQEGTVLRVALIASMMPVFFKLPGHYWYTFFPRGPAVIFFFCALLLWLDIGPLSLSKFARLILVLLFLSASVLAHQGMAYLLLFPTLLVWLGYHLFKVDLLTWAGKLGPAYFLGLFNLAIILVAATKFILIKFFDPGFVMSFNIEQMTILIWLIAVNGLVYFWLKRRSEVVNWGGDSLQSGGDTLFRYFVPFSIFSVGFNIFQPAENLQWGRLFFAYEAGHRFFAIVHLLWWISLGILIYDYTKSFKPKALRLSAITILVLMCSGITIRFLQTVTPDRIERIFRQEMLTVQMDTVLARSGVKVYSNEVLYFQALANDLKARHAGSH